MVDGFEELTACAAGQHGVISASQLAALIPEVWARRRLVASGWLRWEAPRVLAVAGAPATWERSLMTGLLSLGDSARVSHRAAAALFEFDRCNPSAVEFLLPRDGRGRRSPFVVHTTSHLSALDTVTVSGLKVTSATRTIIDLARLRVPTVELESAIDSAVRSGMSAPVVIDRRLQQIRGRGRWGCRRLDELLIDSGGHTRLERLFLKLVRAAGLPRPLTQVVHRSDGRTIARVDFLFDPYDVVVEVTGQHGHASPTERSIDAQRRNELHEIGRRVIEYTWHHITTQPAYVRRSLVTNLQRAGWPAIPPTPRP